VLDFVGIEFDINGMSESKQQREKRLALALRENLKRRKVQMRQPQTPDEGGESGRKFREKPITSPKPEK